VKALIRICALLAVAVAALQAQAPKASMEAIKMPAPFYNKTDDIGYPGDWGYWTVGSLRNLDGADLGNVWNWNWVRYTNSGNAKEVWAMAALSGSACNHAHVSYGVWGYYKMKIMGIAIKGWTRIGMGTQSGEKINGVCKFDVDNSWVRIVGSDYGWGTNYATANYKNSNIVFTEFVVGALANSHGSGACGSGIFQCGHPVNSYLWTIP
jgi:hypothetical protein